MDLDIPIVGTHCRNSYSNCTYGVYFDRSNNLALEQEVTVRFCSFAYNHCGVFVRDNSFSNGQQYLKATITEECTFGGDAPEDQNEYGISLSNCKEAIIDGCDFNNKDLCTWRVQLVGKSVVLFRESTLLMS